jgi:hypothetical protein
VTSDQLRAIAESQAHFIAAAAVRLINFQKTRIAEEQR